MTRRALLLLAATFALGCGIKAPPLPPLPEPQSTDGGAAEGAPGTGSLSRDAGEGRGEGDRVPAEPPPRSSPAVGPRSTGADGGTP